MQVKISLEIWRKWTERIGMISCECSNFTGPLVRLQKDESAGEKGV